MTDHVMETGGGSFAKGSRVALKLSAQFWFLVAVLGQWIFVYYVASHYLGLANDGKFYSAENSGYIQGDVLGNIALVLHLSAAVVILFGGTLQLMPQVREKYPVFHRWTGRTYVVTAMATSVGGLYMLWTREIPGGLVMGLGMSLDAVLILVFGALAWKEALVRNIKAHRRWALRLFMVVSAVWFFRVGFMAWVMINQGPVGFDPGTFTGPFITFWVFAQYMLPLAFLELYFRAQESRVVVVKIATASLLSIATLLMGFGVFGAVVGMWFPELM